MTTDRLLRQTRAVLVSVALGAIVGSCADTTAPSNLKTAASFSGAADTTPPSVVSTVPSNGATNVSVTATLSVTFSEAMDASTINATNINSRTPLHRRIPALSHTTARPIPPTSLQVRRSPRLPATC